MTSSLPQHQNVLVLSGSARKDSLNTRLARLSVEAAARFGANTILHTVGDFSCPGYDGDDEDLTGLPAGAIAFGIARGQADAFVIACPEYSASMPGTVKNLGAHIYPDMFSPADAGRQLSAGGHLASDALADRFTSTVTGFLDLVEAAKHYPCARTAWIEFLGEADPGRVQVAT